MRNFKIIKTIDQFLERQNKTDTNPPDANEYLAAKGILRDSSSRQGAPLRKLCRDGEIPHAYKNGSTWVIPHSKMSEQNSLGTSPRSITVPKKQPSRSAKTTHKLEVLGKWLSVYLKQSLKKEAAYHLEYKPDWLHSYPNREILQSYPEVNKLYSALVNEQFDLHAQLEKISGTKLSRKQSYDIWIGEPFNFAVEFDEKQHFNQYRALSLNYYKSIKTNFSLNYYKALNTATTIRPGKSGFTKLKSNDPLFPEMLPGEAQDNRIRQRAFRDFLKDLLPIVNGYNPTLRIPYHVTNAKIKDFNSDDFKSLRQYLDEIELKF